MTDNVIELPNSREAEEALLGSVIISPYIFPSIDIQASDFYQVRHRQIWSAFEHLSVIDFVTVVEYLKSQNQLDLIGGPAYITGLINATASSQNAGGYAEIVRDYSRRRALLTMANDMAKAAFDTEKTIESRTPDFLTSLVDVSRVKDGAEPIQNLMNSLYDDIEAKSKDPKTIWGIPTGFPTFDTLTGGLQSKEMFILSGEPGVGKSILAMQMALQMSETAPGVIYSMEMGGMQLARRMVSGIAQVPTRAIKTGKLKDAHWSSITASIEKLQAANLFISDSSAWTTTSLRADLARLKAQHNIQWFMVDYLYLMNNPGKDEIERTASISKGLKQICSSLDLAGIVIHSMNKAEMGRDSAPGNQSLRGSGQVIYDADLTAFLMKFVPRGSNDQAIPEEDRNNLRTLFFGKGRELEDAQRYIHFVKQADYPLFGEMAIDTEEHSQPSSPWWDK